MPKRPGRRRCSASSGRRNVEPPRPPGDAPVRPALTEARLPAVQLGKITIADRSRLAYRRDWSGHVENHGAPERSS